MPKSIEVFRLAGFDRRSGVTHGQALYRKLKKHRLRPSEALILVTLGAAIWRGKRHHAVILLISTDALYSFVGQMRYYAPPRLSALDSKTHKYLGGNRGYCHIRNHAYSPSVAHLQ